MTNYSRIRINRRYLKIDFTNAEIFFYKLAFNELRPPYIDVEISISDETRLTILGILRGELYIFLNNHLI